MAGEVIQRESSGKRKFLGGRKRRIAVRIDMTPMVDIAFLLLIFYMVSTVFAMPQALEINLPPSEETIPIEASNLITLRVDQDNQIWWNLGLPTKNIPGRIPSLNGLNNGSDYKYNADSVRGLLVAQNLVNQNLNTLILIHDDAEYARMIDILDEIEMVERTLNLQIAALFGKKVSELTREERFSYRYALGDWEISDDRIIEKAKKR